METIDLPLAYLNELAKQTIFISAFLGGFSAAILGTLIVSKQKSKILNTLVFSTALSSLAFIVAVMGMTKLVMISTPGYPFEITPSITTAPRIIGSLAFFIGILSLVFSIGISGWVQSKKLGIMTSVIAAIGMILSFIFLS